MFALVQCYYHKLYLAQLINAWYQYLKIDGSSPELKQAYYIYLYHECI